MGRVQNHALFKSFQVDSSIEVMLRKIVLEQCCQLEFSAMIKMLYSQSSLFMDTETVVRED